MNPGDPQKTDDALSQAYYRDRNVADMDTGSGDSRRRIMSLLAVHVVPVVILLFGSDLVLREALSEKTLLPYMQVEPAFYRMKVDYFLSKPTPDVLFMGSSRIRDAVIPREFCKELSAYLGRETTGYNLGLVNARMEECLTVAGSHLPEPPPPYVVVGFSGTEVVKVHQFNFASRFLWRFPDLTSYLLRTAFVDFEVKNIEHYIEAQICRFWYLFENRDAIETYLTEHVQSLLGIGDPDRVAFREDEKQRLLAYALAGDGYHPPPREGTEGFRTLDELIADDPESIHIPHRERARDPGLFNEKSVEAIDRLVTSLRARGCRVALVETPPSPYLQNWNRVLHGENFRRWMRGVADDLDVPFFAFPPPPDPSELNALYRDVDHLTSDGAKLYTHYLFIHLRDAGFFEEDAP